MSPQLKQTHPRFAVVGHPNKGKSSIVSSLAQDDTVQISDTPGTTIQSRSFPLKLDGRVIYELFDTPGFQRARGVLAWLQAEEVPAHKRPQRVRAFIEAHRKDRHFADEIELLSPIMEGAGILYVVDGSKPYGQEYEAQMEILRWTGQPSMALINQIGERDYSGEWRQALSQYFRIVRSYDPMRADPQQQIALLESMAQLEESWSRPLKQAISLFVSRRERQLAQSAVIIAELIYRALTHRERIPISTAEATEDEKSRIQKRYRQHIRTLETEAQHEIERLWSHRSLQKEQLRLPFEGIDLFSSESASLFGLSRQEMVIGGMTGGAAAGAGIDLLFAGHTLLLGGAIGALAGGVGAYLGFDELSEMKILGRRVGMRYLEMGPMRNRNFPYILLGRALYHLHTVATRSHAQRDVVRLGMDAHFKEKWLDEPSRKVLERLHKKLRSESGSEDGRDDYEAALLTCIRKIV